MRPTRTAAVLALLVALAATTAAPLWAGEANPPKPGPDARAAEAREAAEIGRGLLASDEAVRKKAVDRFLARIEKGGDLAWFLEAMSRATRLWADRHERLMEVWLHDAVHGSAEERERAVRLLAALGDKAIRRLSLELRHARLHGSARPKDAPQEASAAAESEPQAPKEQAFGTPRIYDLGDLFQRGMNPVELRGLLLKTADAVEVKRVNKTAYVVTALDAGHAHLRNRLHDLRVSFQLVERTQADKAEKAVPQPPAAPRALPPKTNKARPQPTVGRATPDIPPAQAAQPRKAERAWLLEPELLHLPGNALIGIAGSQSSAETWSKLPRGLFAPEQHAIRAPDTVVLHTWAEALKRVPDARTGLPLRGARRVASHGSTRLFAGKEIRYSQSVRRTKGGAWSLVTDTIPHGVTLELTLRAEGSVLRVDVVAAQTEVGLPIPVVHVKPSPRAAPVELERPEWSTTRVRRSFDLPLQGGGALVSLRGLGSAPDEHLVLCLKLTQTK